MQELYIPRKKYILPKDEIDNCPDCHTPLIAEKSTVMLYGKSDIDEGEFMSNMSGSRFCHNCPVVVFEEETIEKAVTLGLRIKKRFNYIVLGLIDFAQIPDSKKHLELGIDDNPIPLIKFLNEDYLDESSIEEVPKSKAISKPFKDKKIGRNEPCPCGSGKKYKKCCL